MQVLPTAESQILYDTVLLQFNPIVFAKELLLHVTFPLFAVLGKPCHRFFVFHPASILLGWVVSLCVIVTIVASYYTTVNLRGGYWMPLLLYIVHRSMIALKYATFSHTEYRRYQSCSAGPLLDEYFQQAHLITGWDKKHLPVLEFEVAASAARCGLLFRDHYFRLPGRKCPLQPRKGCFGSDAEKWLDFLDAGGGRVRKSSLGFDVVSVHDVCKALPCLSYDEAEWYRSYGTPAVFGFTFLNVLIPFLRTDLYKDPMSSLDIAYFVCSSYATFVLSFVLSSFLNAAVVDILRQLHVAEALHDMIRIKQNDLLTINIEQDSVDQEMIEPPLLPVECPMTSAGGAAASPRQRPAGVTHIIEFDEEVPAPGTDDDRLQVDLLNPEEVPRDKRCKLVGGEILAKVVPRVDLQWPNNIYCWMSVRSVMKEFGVRFRFRMDVYVGALLVVLFALIAYLVIELITGNDESQFFASVIVLCSK